MFPMQEVAWHDKQGTGQILWKLGADIPQLKTLVGATCQQQTPLSVFSYLSRFALEESLEERKGC